MCLSTSRNAANHTRWRFWRRLAEFASLRLMGLCCVGLDSEALSLSSSSFSDEDEGFSSASNSELLRGRGGSARVSRLVEADPAGVFESPVSIGAPSAGTAPVSRSIFSTSAKMSSNCGQPSYSTTAELQSTLSGPWSLTLSSMARGRPESVK